MGAVFKAAIFNVDGTLLHSVGRHADSWTRTFAHFGVEPSGDGGGDDADCSMGGIRPPQLRRRDQPFDEVDANIRLAISPLDSWLVRWRIASNNATRLNVTNTRSSLLRTPGATLVADADFSGRDGLDTRDSPLVP